MSLTAPPRIPSAMGWSFSGLPLAFWAARHHPDQAARRAIAVALARWAELEDDALLSDGEQLPVVQAPMIAPLVLEDADVADAAALSRLFFSPRINGSRVRVASRDALLGQYGLTVTSARRGYASARDLDRAPRRAEQPVAYLQPRALTDTALDHLATAGRPRVDVRVSVGRSGIIIRVRGARWPGSESALALELERGSGIVDPSNRVHLFTQLDLMVHTEGGVVIVRPRASEAAIKLSALMARRSMLVLRPPERADGTLMYVVAQLAMPSGSEARIPVVASDPVPEVDAWLRISWPGEPTLPLELRLLLARYVPVHGAWHEGDLTSAMLADAESSGVATHTTASMPSQEDPAE